MRSIDSDRAREIQQRYANSTAGYAKYANIEPWLRLNRERVQDLNLHRSERQTCSRPRLRRRILFVHPEESWPLRPRPRHRSRSVVRRTTGVVRRARESFIRSLPSSRCQISVNNSIGSRRSRRTFIFIIRPKNAGEQRNGIFFCAIYSIIWRRAEKSFLDSIPPTTAAIIRPKYAIFFSAVAQTSSANEFFLKTGCAFDECKHW